MEKEPVVEQEVLIEEETQESSEEQVEQTDVELEPIDYKEKYEEAAAKAEENLKQLQRVMAEFDNFRKRTQKEKEAIYVDSVKDVVAAMLPVLDNLDRALIAAQNSSEGLKEGVEMVYRQFNETFNKLGVVPIESVGNSFDPELHNAVMHVEDAQFGVSEVVEEFQKGYVYKGKVIRHSMVKVAN